jgi:predicted DNA-binding protein (MmcQ/YjbR family)
MADALRADVAAMVARFPGALYADGSTNEHDSWKVGGKMFACFGSMSPGVSVKCADIPSADLLIETGVAGRAPYFHRSWVRLPDSVDRTELRHRLQISYRLVRAGLPASLRKDLPELPEV